MSVEQIIYIKKVATHINNKGKGSQNYPELITNVKGSQIC